MLTVHHYYPLGSDNIGDHLVARAIRQAVPRHFGPTTFVGMPVNDRYRASDRTIGLVGENIDRTNAEADLVIVGGSNLLEPRRPPRRSSRRPQPHTWGVFTDAESIERLAPPVMLLGMGTGSDYGHSIRNYQPRAIAEVRLLHQRAIAAAVRDQETARRLEAIGVKAQCTGCAVTFLTDRPVAASGDASLPLLVSFPPGRILKRFSGRRFMAATMRYVAWLKAAGVPLVVTLHETADQPLAAKLVPAGVEVFYTEDLDELIDRYEHSRGVIGFRLHAGLLGLGLGKPIIPVGVDWRGQAFIDTFDLEPWSIRPAMFGQFRKLRMLTRRLLDGDQELVGTLRDAKALFNGRYERFLTTAQQQFSMLAPVG